MWFIVNVVSTTEVVNCNLDGLDKIFHHSKWKLVYLIRNTHLTGCRSTYSFQFCSTDYLYLFVCFCFCFCFCFLVAFPIFQRNMKDYGNIDDGSTTLSCKLPNSQEFTIIVTIWVQKLITYV